jgi:hypothetical protein
LDLAFIKIGESKALELNYLTKCVSSDINAKCLLSLQIPRSTGSTLTITLARKTSQTVVQHHWSPTQSNQCQDLLHTVLWATGIQLLWSSINWACTLDACHDGSRNVRLQGWDAILPLGPWPPAYCEIQTRLLQSRLAITK